MCGPMFSAFNTLCHLFSKNMKETLKILQEMSKFWGVIWLVYTCRFGTIMYAFPLMTTAKEAVYLQAIVNSCGIL